VREPPPPLKGGLPLLAGTHTDLPAHTQTYRRTHRPTGAHIDLPAHTQTPYKSQHKLPINRNRHFTHNVIIIIIIIIIISNIGIRRVRRFLVGELEADR
jgi:kynurenine formamidase